MPSSEPSFAVKPLRFFPAESGVIRFTIIGKPWVQKNNLHIFQMGKGRRFIGHSKELQSWREQMAAMLYDQYRMQGLMDPIDYLVEARLVFWVKRWHEPDLDNLPAVVWDAMQGIKISKGVKAHVTLTDDKLVRSEWTEKIVEGDVDYYGEPRTEIEIRRYDRTRRGWYAEEPRPDPSGGGKKKRRRRSRSKGDTD